MEKDFPYLIGMALIQEGEQRKMPLGGKSLKKGYEPSENPGQIGNLIALELLFRFVDKNETSYIKKYSKDKSFLLIQMSMETMQKELPSIKAKWINDGDFDSLLCNLKKHCKCLWSVNYTKYDGIIYESF